MRGGTPVNEGRTDGNSITADDCQIPAFLVAAAVLPRTTPACLLVFDAAPAATAAGPDLVFVFATFVAVFEVTRPTLFTGLRYRSSA